MDSFSGSHKGSHLNIEIVDMACKVVIREEDCYHMVAILPGMYPHNVKTRLSQKSEPTPNLAATAAMVFSVYCTGC